jgi:hypothetical protein
VLEGIAQNALRGLLGDELDALHDAVDYHVLDARVLALGVLTDQDSINIVVGRLVAGDGLAGSDVGEKIKGPAQGEVERDVAFADGCLTRSAQSRGGKSMAAVRRAGP